MYTFRRPMFRGGKIDSRGTGITSGLSYKKGGRVGFDNGGFGGRLSGSALNPTPVSNLSSGRTPSGGLSGGTLGSRLLSRSMNIPFVGKAIRPIFGGLGGGATLLTGGAGLFGLGAGLGITGAQIADFITRATDTPEAYAFRKEASRPNKFGSTIFDETAMPGMTDPRTGEYIPGEFEEFSETLRKKDQGEKLGFFPRGGAKKRLEEMGLADQFTPEGDRVELPKVLDDLTKNNKNNQDRPGTGRAGNQETSTDIKDAIKEDKELFAELLGAKKARGQDISDMLLSFSSKALAPDATVKSAFAEFAADEVKRPSRVRKVDDSAAALAINAYIAGEKSKADLERALKATEGKLNLEQQLLKNRSLTSRITNDRSSGKTFSKIVSDNTKLWMEDNGIPGTPNKVKVSDIEKSTGPGQGLLVPENENAVFIDDTNKVYMVIKDGAGNLTLKNFY